MTDTTFALTRFDNRNGTTSWRISGWLASVRIRKNFKSREEATAEKAFLEIKAAQIISGPPPFSPTTSSVRLKPHSGAWPISPARSGSSWTISATERERVRLR